MGEEGDSGAHSRTEPSCFPRSSSCFAISVKLLGPCRVQRDDSAHIRIRRHLPVAGREAPLAGAVGIFNTGVASESYGSVYCYVTAGKLFEKVCLWWKPLDGMRFTATSLIDASDADFDVPLIREVLLQDWKTTASLVPDLLYVPRISSLESGDCLYLVSLPTTGGGAADHRGQVTPRQGQWAPQHPARVLGRGQGASEALVFVQPAHGELNGKQTLHTQKGKQMDDDTMIDTQSSSICKDNL